MRMPEPNLISPLIVSLVAPYALVLAAPGPNLLVVLRASLVPSLLRPVAAALGIACGATMAAAVAAYSATFVLPMKGLEYLATIAFSAILFRSAFRLLSQKPRGDDPADLIQTRRISSIFALGLFAALSNPMSIPFFVSFFVANPAFQTSLPLACLVVFAMASIWFSAIGMVFARAAARNLGGSSGFYFRRILALLMIGCAIAAVWKQLST
jgi:amino acid exporter